VMCHHMMFYVLNTSGLSVITTKLKAKKMFAQLPCCYLTFYKTSYLKTLQMSGRSITIHNFRALKSVLSVIPTLQVITNFLRFRKAGKLITILLLFPTNNNISCIHCLLLALVLKTELEGGLQWHNIPDLIKINPLV
jgi:hypothetical protein